ncbi:MAG: CTP synthase (glutamine hydrolyzing) [Candidatus Aenigmatarchaeota archaeon]
MPEDFNSIPPGYKRGKTKYIVVVGSVISGVGKGTFTSSLGNILALHHGYRVSPIKFDGYLNCDAGTLNPYRHGEVFVLEDGTECDLDLGTYERMLNTNLTNENYLTAGKLFKMMIDKERTGGYLGRDVQFIPHVTGEIKLFLRKLAMSSNADIVLIEVGGTVGDIENSYFLEAIRELMHEEGKENLCLISIVYILEPGSLGEQKSKAAQLGLKTLLSIGLKPDIVVCRAERPVSESVREKIAVFSNTAIERVISLHDVQNIHKVPVFLRENRIDKHVLGILGLRERRCATYREWEDFIKKVDAAKKTVNIAIAGKYTGVHDAYISIIKALEHAAPQFGARPEITWIETTELKDAKKMLGHVDGLIVPGGFGARGIEGKIECIRYARENSLPFLGLCLGFQLAVIEWARSVLGLNANSTEFEPNTPHPVIDIMPEQKGKQLGGTMRLGKQTSIIKKGSIVHKLYGRLVVEERHRHRYEVNPKYIQMIERSGLVFSGKSPDGRMEFLELPGHPFFVATQAHPEFSSKPLSPNPLFKGFVRACLEKSSR